MEHQQLFDSVKKLAKEGKSPREIGLALGFKSPFSFQSKIILASQSLGKPVPVYSAKRGGTGTKTVETIKVKQRGKGESFGASIPKEVLERAQIPVDATLAVKCLKGRIILTVQ